jgi:hypothetical protein
MLSSGLFTGVCSLNTNVSEHFVCSIFIGEWVCSVTAVENVGYCTWKGLARKIAWASRKEVVGVGALRSVPKRWHLTFRNPASYIKDGHTTTLNTPHFLYFFQQIHVLNFLNMLNTLHFFLFKMPFIS